MNSSSSNFRLITTAILSIGLLSCASYEFGEYPLNQAEIDYLSKVDPAAATIRDLGGNTFDVTNPTLHAVLTDPVASWTGRQAPVSLNRYTNTIFTVLDQFPNVERAYESKIAQVCQQLDSVRSAGQIIGDFTIRYTCLTLSQWIQIEYSESIQNCRSSTYKYPNLYNMRVLGRHPCYREEVQGTPFPEAYCDAYTQATGIELLSEYSCRDLVNNYERRARTSQERSTAEQASSQRENQCREFGFVEGTPEMANCLLELYKIENQPQQNTVIANPAPNANSAPNPAAGIELMNRGLQILNGAGTPSAPAATSSSRCTRIGDISRQVYTFNSPACPAGYAPAF